MKHSLIISATMAAAALLAISCSRSGSGTCGVRTQALDDSAWTSSEWISAADAPVVEGIIEKGNYAAASGASWFVAKPENAARVVSAKWMITSLGVFQPYLNGVPVGEEFLRPGFTHHEKTKYSFTYDCTDAFNKAAGEVNVLSAQVTPGWWADKIVTPGGHDGMIGRKCALRSVLQLTYADGRQQYFGTDTLNWKAGIAGPVQRAGIFDGEIFDARIRPGYETPQLLGTPEVNNEFPGRIFPSEGAEVYLRRDIALSPVEAYVWKDIVDSTETEFGKVVIDRKYAPGEEISLQPGETLVIDFGQNCSAVPSFVFKADEGTLLTCLPSEILNDGAGDRNRGMDGPEGSCHRTNLRQHSWAFRTEYTFGAGEEYSRYTPSCTFFGYRYLSVTATGNVAIKSIQSVPVTSIAKEMERGEITTGNKDINKLISNTLWGQRSNYLSVPTDCPQRDERLGWTADTQVFTEAGSFFASTDRFFHKWMRDMRDSQNPSGAFPGVAPLAQYGGDMMRLGWSDAGVIVPWTVWKQFGDTSIIDENWDAMALLLEHQCATRYDHTANKEENRNYQWADWLSYEALESHDAAAFEHDAKGRRIPKAETVTYWNYLSACYWALDASMMADMAAATLRDEAKYRAIAVQAADFLKTFLNPDGSFKCEILNTMQTPALFALKTGIVEGQAKENVCARLRENFARHDGCLQTGFLGTSILMQTLSENAMADIAWNLLFQRKNPSWLYSVDNGATTIWERWNSYTAESGMGPKGMNSFNHYAYGCVCQWIWETAAGICATVQDPGFGTIVMAPVPDKRLGSIDARLDCAAGLICSKWEYEGDLWKWTFTIPKGTRALVTLPGEGEAKEYAAGKYTVSKNL